MKVNYLNSYHASQIPAQLDLIKRMLERMESPSRMRERDLIADLDTVEMVLKSLVEQVESIKKGVETNTPVQPSPLDETAPQYKY